MSDAISAINAVCSLIDKVGTWPIGITLIIILLGPWIYSVIMMRVMETRFERVIEMYKNNVKLVEAYEEMSSGMQEILVMNTSKWTETLEAIRTNQFCPAHRTVKKKMEDVA